MTPAFAARRRAEEFNSLVEGTSTEEHRALPESGRYAELLEVVGALRESPEVEPRAEFVADLRHRLMTEAATVLTPTTAKLTLAPRRKSRERRLAVAIGGFAVVSATASMAVAAQSALPGDTLYPLKRAIEDASTTIRADEDAKGSTLLAHASGRLEEVEKLTRRSDEADAEAVTDTLHAFSEQATEASELLVAAYTDDGDKAAIDRLRDFADDSMAELTQLESVVPEPARAALIEASQVVAGIDSRAVQLCPSCGDGVAQVPDFATTSAPLDGVLDDLGVALGAPTTPAPGTGENKPPKAGGKDSGQAPVDPDTVPILPDLTDPDTGSGSGDGDGSGSGTTDDDDNLVRNLTDPLTGGGDDESTDSGSGGSLTDVLDDAVDGIVGGLLGD